MAPSESNMWGNWGTQDRGPGKGEMEIWETANPMGPRTLRTWGLKGKMKTGAMSGKGKGCPKPARTQCGMKTQRPGEPHRKSLGKSLIAKVDWMTNRKIGKGGTEKPQVWVGTGNQWGNLRAGGKKRPPKEWGTEPHWEWGNLGKGETQPPGTEV